MCARSDVDAPFEIILPRPEQQGCANGTCSMMALPELRYRPLHPKLFGNSFRREWFAPSFAEALADGSEKALRKMLRVEVTGRVFSFEMLKLDFCEMLLNELQHYEASGNPVTRPNSMNNYGVIVNQIGMKPLLDDLQASLA